MRIAYIITRADAVGGASIHVRDLARAMRDRGHEVLVLIGGTGPVTEQFASVGIPYRPLNFLRRALSPWRDGRAIYEIAGALRAFRPEVVSAHTAKAGWAGRAACAGLRIPVIYTPHGLPVADRISKPAGRIFTWAERLAGRWANAIVCVCEYERQLAAAKRIAPLTRLHVIYNGVVDVAPELQARPGASPVRIVSVARLEAPKDHPTLLRALAILGADQRWELDLVGDGPREPELRALAAGLGIGARVRFAGYQADPAPALSAAHLFVLASRSEAFPRSILEAMRAGLPVIASAVGGIAEAVVPEKTGKLVPAGSAEALANAIKQLIKNDLEREQMGKAGRQKYETDFRFERMFERTMNLYATIVGYRSE